MIIGIGIDVVDIARFEDSLARTPALSERVFSPSEACLPIGSMAGRFAAKEALAKALGAPGLVWRDAEISNDVDGRPLLAMTGSVAARASELAVTSSYLSISHDAGIVSAVVVLEG